MIQGISFEDAKGTHALSEVKIYSKRLEFAPYQRYPTVKQRPDTKYAGLIDQDRDFMDFLESQTQPITKPPSLEVAHAETQSLSEVKETPLIKFLRESKAAKAAAKNKSTKAEVKPKGTVADSIKPDGKKTGKGKDYKDVKPESPKPYPAKPVANAVSKATSAVIPTGPKSKRERPIQDIKSMLKKDLGIKADRPQDVNRKPSVISADASSTSSPRSGSVSLAGSPKTSVPSRKGSAAIDSSTASPVAQRIPQSARARSVVLVATSSVTKSPSLSSATPVLPANRQEATSISGNSTTTPMDSANISSSAPPTVRSRQRDVPPVVSSPGATKAFLKHANASQGITEENLKSALETFGKVISVYVEKNRGTAQAEFADPESLAKAMAMKKVPVAQGQVEVSEYQDRSGNARSMRGGRGGRGGSIRGRMGSRGGPMSIIPNTNTNSATTAPVGNIAE